MANSFPRAELPHKQQFQFTPEMMTLLPVVPKVRSWTGSDDWKWFLTFDSNTANDLVSLQNDAINPSNSLRIYWAAAQTLRDSRTMAFKWFINLERSLKAKDQFKQIAKVMKEYFGLNHPEVVLS